MAWRYTYIIVLVIWVGLYTLVLVVNLQLILFHVYLKIKGISTFEFIMRKKTAPELNDTKTNNAHNHAES
jgi:hypothetical protein